MDSHKRSLRNGRNFSGDNQSKLLMQNPMKTILETVQNCYEGTTSVQHKSDF